MIQTKRDRAFVAIAAIVLAAVFIAASGCATKPSLVIDTQVIDKPVVAHCTPELPKDCRSSYAVDGLQPGADPVQGNRALRAEIEQRAACEIGLRAAIIGCKK